MRTLSIDTIDTYVLDGRITYMNMIYGGYCFAILESKPQIIKIKDVVL